MITKTFRTNDAYFDFIKRYKNSINIIKITFTRTRQIRITYDII